MQILLAILIILFASPAWGACTGSSPTWTTDGNELADVQECLAAASAGDTINVIAGDGAATWSAQLDLTVGVKIKGPGAANLTITNAFTGNDNRANIDDYLITYVPSDSSANNPFEISDFTFDMDNKAGFLWIVVAEGHKNLSLIHI